MPKVGDKAPDFTLPDQSGKEHALSKYRGRYVLLYFYPKDNTTGCTKEACAIRNAFPRFEGLNAEVFGVSVDSVESHKKFSEEYQLPFPLLADTDRQVVEKYGVWGEKKMMGRTYMGTKRTSFLIGLDGTIEKIYENVKPEVHAEEVLADLQSLNV
jgi:peroxiredoxin Q/BCP